MSLHSKTHYAFIRRLFRRIGSANGAGGSARAAVDAIIGSDHELAVLFRNSANRAFADASAAGDAFIGNLISHDKYLLQSSGIGFDTHSMPIIARFFSFVKGLILTFFVNFKRSSLKRSDFESRLHKNHGYFPPFPGRSGSGPRSFPRPYGASDKRCPDP